MKVTTVTNQNSTGERAQPGGLGWYVLCGAVRQAEKVTPAAAMVDGDVQPGMLTVTVSRPAASCHEADHAGDQQVVI